MIERVNDRMLEQLIDGTNGWMVIKWFDHGSIPCAHFKAEFAVVSKHLQKIALFLEIDAEQHPEYTAYMNVEVVPTTMVMKDGEILKLIEGPYSSEGLQDRLVALIGPKKRRRKKK